MTNHSKATVRRETLILFALAAMNFCHILDFMIMMPLGPKLMRLFEINATMFGFLVSSYTFSAAVAGLLGTFLVDKFERKKSLLIVFGGFMLGTLACALAGSYQMLMLARIISGAFGGVVGAMLLAIVGDIVPAERRGRATGILMGAFSLSSVAGIPIGLLLAEKFEWHAPFFAIVITSAIVVPVVFFMLPSIKDHLGKQKEQSLYEDFLSVVRYPPHRLCLAMICALMFGSFTVIPFISTYAVANLHVPEAKLSLIYMFGGLATFFSAPFFGNLADKFGNEKLYPVLILISIFTIILLTNLTYTPLWAVLTVTTAFMVFISGRMIVAFNSVNSFVNPSTRGGFMSLNSAVQQMSSGAASFVASFIVQQTPEGPMSGFQWAGLIAVLGNLISLYFMHRLLKMAKSPLQVLKPH